MFGFDLSGCGSGKKPNTIFAPSATILNGSLQCRFVYCRLILDVGDGLERNSWVRFWDSAGAIGAGHFGPGAGCRSC